jgi:hypothetical protein
MSNYIKKAVELIVKKGDVLWIKSTCKCPDCDSYLYKRITGEDFMFLESECRKCNYYYLNVKEG